MSLLEKIISIPVPENSGSRSDNRFQYQKNWALIKMIELIEDNQDFIFLFDYYDDILMLEPSSNPQKIHFFQIKTKKSRDWTLNQLTKVNKGELNSIAGKLLKHVGDFDEDTASLNIVSNAHYNIKLNDGSNGTNHECFPIHQIEYSELQKIKDKLFQETNTELTCELDDKFFLVQTSLSLDDQERHIKGILGEFLEKYNTGYTCTVSSLFKTLSSEIQRKNSYELDFLSKGELLKNKSISSSELSSMVSSVTTEASFLKQWDIYDRKLVNEGYGVFEIKELEKEARNVFFKKIASDDKLFHCIYNDLSEYIENKMFIETVPKSIKEFLFLASNYIKNNKNYHRELYSDKFIDALALVIAYENDKF